MNKRVLWLYIQYMYACICYLSLLYNCILKVWIHLIFRLRRFVHVCVIDPASWAASVVQLVENMSQVRVPPEAANDCLGLFAFILCCIALRVSWLEYFIGEWSEPPSGLNGQFFIYICLWRALYILEMLYVLLILRAHSHLPTMRGIQLVYVLYW